MTISISLDFEHLIGATAMVNDVGFEKLNHFEWLGVEPVEF